MTIRFFILQAHYRSTLDFSNEALKAAEKGYKKLMEAVSTLGKLQPGTKSTSGIKELEEKCYEALNDDFNSSILIAHLFEGVRIVNSVHAGLETISADDLDLLKKIFNVFAIKILGFSAKGGDEESSSDDNKLVVELMELILDIREQARENKDFATSDKIREGMTKLNIKIKDEKGGTVWSSDV